MNVDELPPTLDMEQACELIGCCSKVGYRLVAEGTFPSPVLRLGRRIRIPTAPLLEVLGIAGASDSTNATVENVTRLGGADALAP